MLRRPGGEFRARSFARGALALIAVGLVTLSAILGGHRYLYCRAMDEVMTDASCACAARADADGQRSNNISNDCVEVRFLARLVCFTVGSDFAVPAAPFVAVLPIPTPATTPAGIVVANAAYSIRAGPFSPTAHRAQLMVFLT